jgi:hypothetical protein
LPFVKFAARGDIALTDVVAPVLFTAWRALDRG